jgi:hypothetical protein
LGACIVRDARYLNWRFVDDPNKKFTAFRALRGQTTVGYLVVGLTEKKGCRVAFLASGLLTPDIPNMADELRALARGPLEELDADVWLSLEGGSAETDAIGAHPFAQGYLPFPKPLNFIHKCNRGRTTVARRNEPKSWFWQTGDLDFF